MASVGRGRRSSTIVWKAISFFFFQAEDGIRDLTVTGVQTCALPISRLRVDLRRRHHRDGGRAQPHLRRRWGLYRSEEHTSELQSQSNLVCRLLLEKKKKTSRRTSSHTDARHTKSHRPDIQTRRRTRD